MLDDRISKIRKAVCSLIEWQKTETVFTANLSTHTEAMFDFIKRSMGKKTNDLPAEFDGPTIWKVIENLIERFLNIDADLKKEVSSSLSG